MTTIYLDAGHGGINPQTGEYKALAGGKFFAHPTGIFHKGTTFLEGVFNRDLAIRIEQLLAAKNIRVVRVFSDWIDTPLGARCRIANADYNVHKDGYLISIHANASANGKARGFSVWTTQSTGKADILAQRIFEAVKAAAILPMREDKSDGDSDYEANFQMLRDTAMPAVLIETAFFDNYQDASILIDKNQQQKIAAAIVAGILTHINQTTA